MTHLENAQLVDSHLENDRYLIIKKTDINMDIQTQINSLEISEAD